MDSILKIVRSSSWALSLLVLTASVAMASAETPDRVVTDAGIQATVEDEILFDEMLSAAGIEVSAADGIVTLTGVVDHAAAKDRAVRVARAVKGVRSVVNQLVVVPRSARTDDEIHVDVKAALLLDRATDGHTLEVEVNDGRVTLTGEVGSWQEKNVAEMIAGSVSGVREVVNDVEVAYTAERPDDEIRSQIERILEYDVFVDDGLVDVTVENAEVTLTGTVGSATEKWRATTNAWVGGVKKVDNSELEVARWARDDDLRQHKYVQRSDGEIHDAIEDAMRRDPRVAAFAIDTDVERGHVTLTGTVDRLLAARAAEQNARNTVGVYQVDNRIEVKPVELATDSRIHDDVVAALARDSIVESYEIDVDVSQSKVELEGEVDSYFEKYHAETVAARVPGVVEVDNELAVTASSSARNIDPYVDGYYYSFGYLWYPHDEAEVELESKMTDAEIREEIEDELWWSPFVDADQVNVTVENGVATLIGVVDSWAELDAAIENAYEGGASRVMNQLVVSRSES